MAEPPNTAVAHARPECPATARNEHNLTALDTSGPQERQLPLREPAGHLPAKWPRSSLTVLPPRIRTRSHPHSDPAPYSAGPSELFGGPQSSTMPTDCTIPSPLSVSDVRTQPFFGHTMDTGLPYQHQPYPPVTPPHSATPIGRHGPGSYSGPYWNSPLGSPGFHYSGSLGYRSSLGTPKRGKWNTISPASTPSTRSPVYAYPSSAPPGPQSPLPASAVTNDTNAGLPSVIGPVAQRFQAPRARFHYLVIIDFEATFDPPSPNVPANSQGGRRPSNQEIIEFPLVVFDLTMNKVVDEFHRYVRPIHRPQLTRACIESTGIEQRVVDNADTFAKVFEDAMMFIGEYDMRARATGGATAFVLCGDWDLRKMLPQQCKLSGLPVPACFRRWINLKKGFAEFVNTECPTNMREMLQRLKLPLIGRHHSGIDDARNVASVLKRLIELGYEPALTTNPDTP
ncbi:ERI1 exoribonuclease 3 [Dimargaris verticillata]|uniref:ERI1 exoribonuclease 3 n=1 Tax=Dimargaris verticillata TaxID=2761393 RepID=A0A9W8B9S6_9FUNG|nr:ERI1 exoribonuclease 3 [Dimargaris verticillata]